MRLRIAQIAAPWLPVPPKGYGGTETIVAHLCDGLVERGHDVTLFAAPGSATKARLSSHYDDALGLAACVSRSILQVPHLLAAYERAHEFDVIHDHTFPSGPIIGFCVSGTDVVHTAHGAPDYGDSLPTYEALGRRVGLVAVSHSQRRSAPSVDFVATIHNGIDTSSFPFEHRKRDHMLFVGRMCPEKGVDTAIDVAERTGRELRIAAKMDEPDELAYFRQFVEPRLSSVVTYIGEVRGPERARLFGHAACTVAPGRWAEPFGLVLVESLACGTAVVATDRGAAPEIVDHAVTGFLAPDVEGLAAGVEDSHRIDPAACRRAAVERFDRHRMVEQYEALYLRRLGARRS